MSNTVELKKNEEFERTINEIDDEIINLYPAGQPDSDQLEEIEKAVKLLRQKKQKLLEFNNTMRKRKHTESSEKNKKTRSSNSNNQSKKSKKSTSLKLSDITSSAEGRRKLEKVNYEYIKQQQENQAAGILTLTKGIDDANLKFLQRKHNLDIQTRNRLTELIDKHNYTIKLLNDKLRRKIEDFHVSVRSSRRSDRSSRRS